MVELIIRSMERSDKEAAEGADPEENHWLWLHISSQLIYFILFQFALFPNIVNALHEKVCRYNILPYFFLFNLYLNFYYSC